MAVLNREDFFNRIHTVFGEDASPESISFIEDMSDTYNDLDKRVNGDGTDWKTKYEENDKAWREKYKHRFFSGDGGVPDDADKEEEKHVEEITVEDLFE